MGCPRVKVSWSVTGEQILKAKAASRTPSPASGVGAGQGAEALCLLLYSSAVFAEPLVERVWEFEWGGRDSLSDQQWSVHGGLCDRSLAHCPPRDPGHCRAAHLLLLFVYHPHHLL